MIPPVIFGMVGVLALVQSWFGVGVLLFGTPLLLILGVPYRSALWILLPCSLTISLLQLLVDRRIDREGARRVIVWAVPALVVGLLIEGRQGMQSWIGLAVAAALLISAGVRLFDGLAARGRAAAIRFDRPMLVVTGFVHGLTNMGGSLLPAYAAARHTEQYAVRQLVALAYAIFASSQLLVLALTTGFELQPATAAVAALAGTVFLTVGRFSFSPVQPPAYNVGLSLLMVSIAVMLIWRSLA
jgi:uncharacterized membrane protein YfcA